MLPRPSVEKGAPPSLACWSCLYANLLPELENEPGSLGKVMQNLLGCHRTLEQVASAIYLSYAFYFSAIANLVT